LFDVLFLYQYFVFVYKKVKMLFDIYAQQYN